MIGFCMAKDPGNRGVGDRLERILTAVGVDHDITTYPEAGHAFMNDHDRAELPALSALQFRLTGRPKRNPELTDSPSSHDADQVAQVTSAGDDGSDFRDPSALASTR